MYDRQLDRISSNKVHADETMLVLELFRIQKFNCSVYHFHDAPMADRSFTRSYDRIHLNLQ